MTWSLTDSCTPGNAKSDMRSLNRVLLRKLLGLSPAAWAELWLAQYALIRAQILIWTRPRGELLVPSVSAPLPVTSDRAVAPAVRRLALAVGRAAEHGLFRPTCLVQAVALQRMITSRGFTGSSVRVGIRVLEGRFLAHAWVDYRGAVLGDGAWEVSRFDELASMDVMQPS